MAQRCSALGARKRLQAWHWRTTSITRIAYYDHIAKQWNRVTGYHGGAFKRYVLNDCILEKVGGIQGSAILEIGAGSGYFAPMLLRRFSGQPPSRLIISDQSQAQLETAQTTFRIHEAEYLQMDAQDVFPLEDSSLDLILAIMVLNELPTAGLHNALRECRRVLHAGGRLIAAVPHPTFIHALARKGTLTDFGRGLFAMPSAEGMRLPVSRRSAQAYTNTMTEAGFSVATEDVFADEKTLHAKPGLKLPRGAPLALILDCKLAE